MLRTLHRFSTHFESIPKTYFYKIIKSSEIENSFVSSLVYDVNKFVKHPDENVVEIFTQKSQTGYVILQRLHFFNFLFIGSGKKDINQSLLNSMRYLYPNEIEQLKFNIYHSKILNETKIKCQPNIKFYSLPHNSSLHKLAELGDLFHTDLMIKND